MENYWNNRQSLRLRRRSALILGASLPLGAAFLAACGGGSDSGKQLTGPTGLLAPLTDTSKRAKRGGIATATIAEPGNLDPQGSGGGIGAQSVVSQVYGRLVIDKPGLLGAAEFKEIIPDLAESWEFSPDRLTLTMKLRQNVKFHNRPPVNGRTLEAQDVTFSWDRYKSLGMIRASYANSINAGSPIVSITSPDARTISVKLAFPSVNVLALLSSPYAGRMAIVPKEIEGGFDPRQEMIGTGPFMLSKFEPSRRVVFRRHPEYFVPDRPYLDEVQANFVPEYATAVAQFKAGNLLTFNGLKGTDAIPLKREVPAVNLYAYFQGNFFGMATRFGLQGSNAPFKDERVRQAFSMALDRDTWIDTFFETKLFEDAGVPMERRWNSHMYAASGAWWLDPQSKDFGPNAKYFKYDVTEAKKLMAAAGFSSGFEVPSERLGGPQYGPQYPQQVEVIDGMQREIGIRPKAVPVDMNEHTRYAEAKGQFEGYMSTLFGADANDAVAAWHSRYHTNGSSTTGFSDPAVDQTIEKARTEFDTAKRLAILADLQRSMAQKMHGVFFPGLATQFSLAWPALSNHYTEQGDQARSGQALQSYSWWIDDTQPPIKS